MIVKVMVVMFATVTVALLALVKYPQAQVQQNPVMALAVVIMTVAKPVPAHILVIGANKSMAVMHILVLFASLPNNKL